MSIIYPQAEFAVKLRRRVLDETVIEAERAQAYREGFAAAREAYMARAARLANCPHCWQRPGPPCTISVPAGDHLARYQRAERRGLITRDELAAVVARLEVVAPHVIVDGAL